MTIPFAVTVVSHRIGKDGTQKVFAQWKQYLVRQLQALLSRDLARSSAVKLRPAFGAERVVDYKECFDVLPGGFDVVLDMVGGDTHQQSLQVLKPGGILVSVVSPVPEATQKRYGVRAAFFNVDVTIERLSKTAELFDSGKPVTNVGTVLPLEKARTAHEMLAGAPHKRGKIALGMAG